jgi:hypothetical protein
LGELRHRNQKDANAEAISFIDKVELEALKAVKDGLVTNSDVKMFIDEAITRLKTEISDEINRNPETGSID